MVQLVPCDTVLTPANTSTSATTTSASTKIRAPDIHRASPAFDGEPSSWAAAALRPPKAPQESFAAPGRADSARDAHFRIGACVIQQGIPSAAAP